MTLSTAIRIAIEAIDRVLKREYTFESNLHDAGISGFENEAKHRDRLLMARDRLVEELENS